MSPALEDNLPDAQPGVDPPPLLGGTILILIGFWIYWPAISGGWLWDDMERIVNNPIVHSPDGYWRVWVNADPLQNYYPLTSLVEWLEWRLWGNVTLGYHLLSVVLHLTSALLLWKLFHRLGFAFAWVGAMLWMTHPLMVESVAWVSELKNTLALPPLLMAVLTWLNYDKKPEAETYRTALVWFALSLLAKSSGLMLPVFLPAYLWCRKGTFSTRDARNLTPFFVLALAAGVVTLMPPHLSGFHSLAEPSWNILSGLASIGWTGAFLLLKCFIPMGLVFDYAGLAVMHPALSDLLPWLIFFVIALFLVFGWKRWEWIHPAGWGLGFFLINLIPVLLYVGLHYGEMIWSLDHLVYVPILGLVGWIIAWLENLRRQTPHSMPGRTWLAIAAVLVVFSWGSHSYARNFTGQDVFWRYMLENQPQNWRIQEDSGISDLSQNRPADALEHFQKAIALQPEADQPYDYMGEALLAEGKVDAAEQSYLKAAALNPHEMKPFVALAGIKAHLGDYQDEEKYLTHVRLIAPDAGSPLGSLAGLMIQTGRVKEGLDLYAQSVKLDPGVMQVRYNYGVALLQAGDYQDALEQLQAAVDLQGDFAPSRENLGAALAQSGAVPDAIEQFEAAVKLDPNYVAARDNLGLAYAQTSRLPEAIEQFQKALEIDPKDAKARDYLDKLQHAQAAPSPTVSPK